MPRKMYDSVTAAHIPPDAAMVGGYISGPFKWSDADWARFPHAVHVPIATQAYVMDGIVLDVEKGDATPTQAPGWVTRRRQAGFDPTIYCTYSQLSTVISAFIAAGVKQPHYWIAHWDNVAALPGPSDVNIVAKQYINPPQSGGHFDLSIVADFWPGVDTENTMAGEADFAFKTVAANSAAAFGHRVNAGDWLQDFRLELVNLLGLVDALAKDVADIKKAISPNNHIAFVPEGQITIKPIFTE